ncbi:hypothetical protein OPV22_035211, partial [Ensete ventricosum]
SPDIVAYASDISASTLDSIVDNIRTNCPATTTTRLIQYYTRSIKYYRVNPIRTQIELKNTGWTKLLIDVTTINITTVGLSNTEPQEASNISNEIQGDILR